MDLRSFNDKTNPMNWLYTVLAFQAVLVILTLMDVGPPAGVLAGASIGCLIRLRRLLQSPGAQRG